MKNAVISLYKIDLANVQSDFLRREIEFENLSADEIVNVIMDKNREELELPYSGQLSLIETSTNTEDLQGLADEFDIEINLKDAKYKSKLYFGVIETDDRWGPFFGSISASTKKFDENKNYQNSFLLYLILDQDIYAMSSGLAYHQISRYIDDYFGVTVVSHLIDSNITEIRSLQDNALYGNTLSSDRFFGNNFMIANEDSFGKVYKKILASVNHSDLKKEFPFVFRGKDQRSRNCLGKSHFTIYKSVTIQEALLLVFKTHSIYERGMNAKLKISNIRLLKSRKASDKNLIETLDSEVSMDLAFGVVFGSLSGSYLILHKEVHAYFSSHKFFLKYGSGRRIIFETEDINEFNIDIILRYLQADSVFLSALDTALLKQSDQEVFDSIQDLFDRVYLSLENPNFPNRVFEEPLRKFLQCEMDYDGKSYYNLNDKWFTFEKTLNSHVNSEITELLNSIQDQSIIQEKWLSTEDEHGFVHKLLGKRNYYAIHRITPKPNSIELADLIHIGTNNTLNLIHIKNGFDHQIRELSSQVLTSAKLLNDDIKNNSFLWLKAIYQQIKNLNTQTQYFIDLQNKFLSRWNTERKFINEMKSKRIVFYLAFSGNSSNQLVQQHPAVYRSLIAKMSVIATERQFGAVKDRGWDIRICQIINA